MSDEPKNTTAAGGGRVQRYRIAPYQGIIEDDVAFEIDGRGRWVTSDDAAKLEARVAELEAENATLKAGAGKVIAALTLRNAELEAENERLRAVVEQYPKLADGEDAVPEMTVYVMRHLDEETRVEQDILGPPQPACYDEYGLSRCYSTQAAAERAAAAEGRE